MNQTNQPLLGDRFEQALVYATQLHRHQVRKCSNVPYISHLLSVTALVLEDGGSEEEAIAALLHDAIEDQDRIGDVVWDRFKTGKSGTLWYFRSIAEVDLELGSTHLGEELTRVIAQLEKVEN